MRVIRVGKRSGREFYLDLGVRTRIGDMAAVRLWLASWRQTYPKARLTVCFDERQHAHRYSKSIPLDWALAPYVDELWITGEAEPGRHLLPAGVELTNFINRSSPVYCYLWKWWGTGGRKYAAERGRPELTLAPQAVDAAFQCLEKNKVTTKFIAVQPLWDARYHLYRNAPREWWVGLVRSLVNLDLTTVVLGDAAVMGSVEWHPRAYPIYSNVYNSLAIGGLASVFVGGETGLPLWASLLGVPVAATLRHWRLDWKSGDDFRPLSFGSSVVHVPLNGSPEHAAVEIERLYNNRGTVVSTPP